MKRGWEGLVVRAFGGRDFRLTVLGTEAVTGHYHRVQVDGGGLLQACGVHPTMWVRLWFDDDGRPHQRAYTVVDPEPETGRFRLEFALHDGCASRWATTARVGDTIDATVQGTAFALPDPTPTHLYAVGDAASLPALNTLVDSAPDVPATVWLEYAHASDRTLPLRTTRPHQIVRWVPREHGGRHLVDTVRTELPAMDGALYWVAAEAASTRAVLRHVRRDLGVDKHRVHALGYWSAR